MSLAYDTRMGGTEHRCIRLGPTSGCVEAPAQKTGKLASFTLDPGIAEPANRFGEEATGCITKLDIAFKIRA